MVEPPPEYAVVLKAKQRKQCFELRLVLDAAGIPSDMSHRNGWWWLVVERDDLDAAATEIDAYRVENPDDRSQETAPVPVYGGAVAGVIGYVVVITLVAVLASQGANGMDWLSLGQMQAGRVLSGELWRVITALTLHLDIGHLAGNIVFGGLFGWMAGRVLGGGVAWLVILIAGALGNWMNAWVQLPTHSSIGASTAVFAALGLLVSHSLRWRARKTESRFKRWSPLIGGVVLLGLTGVGGERTDVVAHLTGFLAGMLLGWLSCRLPERWLRKPVLQTGLGLATLCILLAAWGLALAKAG